MVNIILELSFVNNLVDLLTYSLDAAIMTNLTNDELAVSTLSELKFLVNWLYRIGNDVFNIEWSEFIPFLLDSLQSLSSLVRIILSKHGRILWFHV
jgi:hypothetical protein